MAKFDPTFAYDIFKFLHKPLRQLDDKEGKNFLERFLVGPQVIFEDTQAKIGTIPDILDPQKTRADLLQYLKDHVGFTKELNNITNDLGENDLRKLISLAVALWKQKGTDVGYANIVRLFTGKTARIFNWFDFRMIVGEKAFGEEQLGEDAWLISVPGVEGSADQSNNVVALFTFEDNTMDRSLTRNHGTGHGTINYFDTPASGFPQGSDKYARLSGGMVRIPNSSAYDLASDFTLEGFIRTTTAFSGRFLWHKVDGSGKGLRIEIDTAANSISFWLSDTVTTITGSLTPAVDLDDGLPRHFSLVVDRTSAVARLYVNGAESTAAIPLGLLGDITNSAPLLIGGDGVVANPYLGDMDNFRLSLNAVYDATLATHTTPLSGFIEFQEELLDEYQTDVRIVDEGDLNKTLILRILNLMRPSSERINVVFIRFFDDFVDGIGQFETLTGSVAVNTAQQMELQPSSLVRTDVLDDAEFKNIVLQVKANDILATGGVLSVLFFVQDVDNYYEFRIDTANSRTGIFKWVAGVPTQLGGWVTEDIVATTSYIYTVVTFYDTIGSATKILAYVDSNKQHEVTDSQFEKGKFGMKTDASTTMQIDEVEMFQVPVDVQRIAPGFSL